MFEGHSCDSSFHLARLPLKPGTASGYVGVQRCKSKKRPWQATLTVAGRGRLNVGSFETRFDAAVARAQEKLANGQRSFCQES